MSKDNYRLTNQNPEHPKDTPAQYKSTTTKQKLIAIFLKEKRNKKMKNERRILRPIKVEDRLDRRQVPCPSGKLL